MVAVVIDFSEKVGKFLDEEISFNEIVFDYYLNFIPWINGLLWPLFALIAVIFFTSRLAKDSEIISILASGVSYYRIMVPYLIASCFLATLLWVGNNYIIPISNEKKATFENTYIWRGNKKTLNENVHMRIAPNEKIFVRYFRQRDSTMIDFRLETFEEGQLTRFLKAKRLKFNNSSGKWTMKDYMVRTFDGMNESMEIESGKELDTLLNFTPEEFIRFSNQMEMMTSPEILNYIEDQNEKGITNPKKFLVEYHRRNADPFTIIILTIIGMSLASRKVRGGLGLNLALGLLLGSLFVLISKFSTTFAYSQTLTPLVGIWIPNIIFTIVAIVLLFRAQK
ncbi:membrane protein [Portibacter lacus]|uniref:Membrane protein n=2 Tax=Portibacter lacus TaxID=1099794 RepID=A0AA37SY97_9BACT|nr:membrane protein [Portibacter lacus]